MNGGNRMESIGELTRKATAISTCMERSVTAFYCTGGSRKDLESALFHLDSLKYALTDVRRAIAKHLKQTAPV